MAGKKKFHGGEQGKPSTGTPREMLGTDRRAVLAVNTHSRAGARLFSGAMRLLSARGILIEEAHPVGKPEQLPGIVKDAVERGSRLVIVGGGDGTISSIVDELAYRDTVLGLLPLGTSNAFARTLGIPLDLPAAVEVIVENRVAAVDLGLVNGDYYANVASIGMSANVARRTPNVLKRHLGPLAYGLVGLGHLASTKPFRCRLTTSDKVISIETRQVVVANGRFFGIGEVGPDANATDSSLAGFTLGERSRAQFLRAWGLFLLGRHVSLPEANYFATRELRVETDPIQWLDVDGEVVGSTPAHFAVADRALRILVPRGFK